MQWFFLIAAILGMILPLSYLIPFLLTNGLDVSLFFKQLFQNNISAFFATDVIVSSVALWLFVFSEGRRLRMSNLWLYVICNLAVGVSLALPLFLFFRQRTLQSGTPAKRGV
jgi:CDP-diglyceride synthetase